MRLFMLLWFSAALLSAHPHIFVDLTVAYDAPQQRLHVEWLIDEATSELIKMDHDTNRNNRFEAAEERALLSEEGYAMLFYRGGFFLHPERPVAHLKASIAGGRVRIVFDTPAAPGSVGIWDDEYLFSFHLKDASGVAEAKEDGTYYGYRFRLK